MKSALIRAAICVLSIGIVAGPFAGAGYSAPRSCAAHNDKGEWTIIQPPDFPEGAREISAYAIDPLAPVVMFATNGSVIMRSTNGGCSWEQAFGLELLPTLEKQVSSVNTTIGAIAIPQVPQPPGRRTIYVTLEESVGPAVRPHVLVSPDGGSSWELRNGGLPLVSGGVYSLAIAPSNPSIAYLLVQESPVNLSDVVYATHNAGGSWEERGTGSNGIAMDLAVDQLDPAALWLWGPGGLFQSSDGGATRTKHDIVATGVSLGDVYHLPGAPARIMGYETETQTFSISTDGGEVWNRITGPRVFSHSMTHSASGEVVVSGHDGIFRMTGQGFWLPIMREEQPDLYDLQASLVDETLLFGLSDANTIERFDALDAEVHVGPFDRVADEVVGGITELSPKSTKIKLDPGDSKTIRYQLGIPPHPTPLDVFFLVDTSQSMEPSINGLRAGMQNIIRDLEAARLDVHFGVGEYKDYPIPGYGDPDMGDFPYRLDRAIGPADAGLADALEKLEASGGGRADLPESQLTGLFQAATGAGDPGFVPPGQDAGFRPGALKVIVHITDAAFHDDAAHPSPPFERVAAVLRERGILQIGLAVYGPHGPDGLPHLTDMALETDTRAPSPVDCDGDGDPDVASGQPLACIVATELSSDVLDLAPAIVASLRAVTQEVTVELKTDSQKFVGGIAPTLYPTYNVLDRGRLDFEVTYACPQSLAGERAELRIAALVAGRPVAHAEALVICRPMPEDSSKKIPTLLAIVATPPRYVIPAPPPPPPPVTESAPGTQQMFQAQPAAAAQEQEELQTAVAWQEAVRQELAEEYSFTSLHKEQPAPVLLYGAAVCMALVYGAASVLGARRALRFAPRNR